MSTFDLKPLNGYTYVHSVKASPIEELKPNAACVVVATTHEELSAGVHVLVDMVNIDFRPLMYNKVQIFLVPNDAILGVIPV